MKKQFLQKLGFLPKENSNNVFIKKYNNYTLEVDFEKYIFNFGWKIFVWKNKTQNITKLEDWVVFECVDRLLEKGYLPEDIILEKVYPTGHWTSWRLDILVKKDWEAFLMIECKTWWKEFDLQLKKMYKDWGQLFTYFQQDRKAKYLVLYTSNISENYNNKDYKNEIVTIEEHYKETTSVVDFYDRWNKITKQNGIFEDWVNSYKFESRALTKKDLKPIKQIDASIIFNSFLEILRKNTVSDKPNAFNKIFTLFLCKIYDEWDKAEDEELEFQWIEGKDNNVNFQLRLNDLYKKWMDVLLEKEVTDLSNDEFNKKYWKLDEEMRRSLLGELNKIRLEKNNEFSIKEVFDHETFLENAIVLKEVVELLQGYKIRYEEKQPFLWDFFELLLTTWLKQEAGQFFTPVPIAKFICKSIPIKNIIEQKLQEWQIKDLLPATIDYAAGSWHFLTESMEEIQSILRKIPKEKLKPVVAKKIKAWEWNFDWAYDYMYGIEKDYRLVKTAKVWCFLHWDWIANVIHWDWLDSFGKSKKYRWRLKIEWHDSKEDKENGNFDLVISNPPYSVSAFKSNLKEYAKDDFTLFSKLTEQSSEIEALFIERTSQLLKEWWIAWIILPSSILSNTWIYTKAREIILKDFEIIAITELGSNTFMATGTNTVTLFLKKRNKYFAQNLKYSVDKFFMDLLDVVFTWTQVQNPVSKYVLEVWEWINFEDYKTLLEKNPNEKIKNHEIFKDYQNKIKFKDLIEEILEIEKEKIFYFVLAYPQKVVLVKSWEKKVEKEFLWYEFSARKWSEGIHPMQRWKQIDECTKLFDPKISDNPNKASTYIFDAFNNNFDRQISEEIKDHIFRTNLSDLLTFDRTDFEKTISLSLFKKNRIESKWEVVKLWEVTKLYQPKTITSNEIKDEWKYKVFWANWVIWYYDKFNHKDEEVLITCRWATCGKINFSEANSWITWNAMVSSPIDKNTLNKRYLSNYLINSDLSPTITWTAQPQITRTNLQNFPIPLPPKDIQQKIVDEIWKLEKIEEKNLEEIKKYKDNITEIISNDWRLEKLENISILIKRWKGAKYWNSDIQIIKSWQARWYREFDFRIKYYVKEWFILDERKLEKWDILINSTWVWTAWRVTQFNLEWTFVVDTHITILRLDNNKAISDYVLNALANIWFKTIEKMAQWQSGQIELSLGIINNLKIPLPPLEKQKEIVWKIKILEEKIEKLKKENKSIPTKKKEILDKYL